MNIAVSDVILYLKANPDFLSVTESVADALSDSVAQVLADQCSMEKRKTLPQGHFWCAFLAALAEAMDAFEGAWLEISHSVRDAVIRRLCEKPFVRAKALSWLVDQSIHTLVKAIWTSVDAAAAHCSGSDQFKRVIRVLALIVCPDMSKHPEVLRWCLIPLYKQLLSESLQEEFVNWILIEYPDLADGLLEVEDE